MLRYLGMAAVGLAVVGLIALLVIRGSAIFSTDEADGEPSPKSVSGTDSDGEKSAIEVAPPEFLEWPDPAAVLVLTGNVHGYMEPCGCSANQAGGLARRSDLFRQLRDQGWPVVGLDLGGSVDRSRKQSQLKFVAITDALRMLDYRGLGMSQEELRLGPAFLLSQHVTPSDGSPGLSFLGTNEVFYGVPDLPGSPKDRIIIELGGMTIGVAMVLGKEGQQEAFPEGGSNDVSFTPPAEALSAAVKAFEQAKTDYNVLLSSADPETSGVLAEKFPQFDFIVSGGGPEDPNGELEAIGEAVMATVGQKGKHAGVLALYPGKEEPKIKFEMVELGHANFAHDPAMDDVMRDYQQSIKDNLAAVFADMPQGLPPKPGTYVGVKKCAECHAAEYEKWTTTKHSHAYQSLIEGRENFEGNWVSRIYDPECLSCHVTGWQKQEEFPYAGGFLPQEIASARGDLSRFKLLKGQQCENCHGPGSVHVAVMEKWKNNPDDVARKDFQAAVAAMTLTLDKSICLRCHDAENSPEFDFLEYWEKVKHSGLGG